MASDVGWNLTTWGNLATLEYGKAIRGYQTKTDGFPVYGTNGPIGFHKSALCDHPGVIIGRKGAYRGVCYSPGPFFVIDTAFYLKPKSDIDLRWAYFQLLTVDINGMDSGSAIPSTSREEFYRLPVAVPPKHEQVAIADFLQTFDDRIDNLRATNATLEAIAQALFKSWFVDFDPVHAKAEGRAPEGMDAATAALFPSEFDDSELGSVPKGWKIMEIGKAVKCVGGATPSTKEDAYWVDGTHCWATPKDLSGLAAPVVTETARQITDAGLERISSGLLPEGTLLMSSRAPIGYLAITAVPTAINQGFIAMLPGGALPPMYLLCWARANMGAIKQGANGSTFMEISKRAFRPMKACVPPKAIVASFQSVVNRLFHRIEANERQCAALASLRDALLPCLISGKLCLPKIL